MKSDDIISSEWSEMMNDLEVSFKQQGYVRCYTSEEIQKIADLQQSMIEKAFELGREDAMSKIILCKDCKHRPTATEAEKGIYWGFSVEFPDELCPLQCEDGWYNGYPGDDFYCGNAERREE